MGANASLAMAAPLELDLTIEELMDQLDPGWSTWGTQGAAATPAVANAPVDAK